METDNSGIIGYSETRININAMKEYYRNEYKKIIDNEKEADSKLFRNKWKIRFGSFAARVGLTFHPNNAYKTLSKLGTRFGSFLIQRIMELKNKSDKRKFKKQRDQLTADFINAEGKFKEFDTISPATVVENEYEEKKGFSR